MTTADKGKIKIVVNGKEVEEVDSFTFLGSTMDRDGECTPEIKRRMAMGRRAVVGMARIQKNKDISLATKCRLVNEIVFAIATYGCETWTLKRVDRRRIDAFELWCWRRLLRIPWTARITNQEKLDRIEPWTSLEARVTKQNLLNFGHIMRSQFLEKDILLGLVSGKRGKGRPS